MKREEVLSAIAKATEDKEAFLEVIRKHRNKKDPFDIAEFFQSLPKKQHVVVWSSLLSLAQHSVFCNAASPEENVQSPEQLSELALSLVTGVVAFCTGALSLYDPVTPDPMREVLQILHDILLSGLEEVPNLQNSVSELLEKWWCQEREGKEGVVPHCLLYVIARTLNEKAKFCDVKRVWLMRKALLLLDFEDPDTGPFKTMLLACTLQQVYLKSDEGRKFLSFLFGMHPQFVEDLHQTIKNQIPLSSKPLLEVYAEIYFRAWRLSSGPYLQQIEEHCLQDLMFCAVHAPRTGPHSLFHSLRKILSHIHQQRAQKGVSEMLLRLYLPFLWRSLKVAHPHVRANAASLLLDAFPLQDPDSTRDKIDEIMQKQFDIMMDLLRDSSVLVRVTGVSGVCRVLSLYFELIPFPVMKSLVGRLVKELAWDSASIDVRVAVLQGLCVVLENRLSHPLLKELLPILHPLLHDNSEKVRLAFLELLILIKGMRTIKFYHVCPTEHLMARMEVDTVHVVKRIVTLLIDAFKPSSSQKIQRCISLLRINRGAARRFYQLAGTHLSPGEVVRFILAIEATLTQCIKEAGKDTPPAAVMNGPALDDEDPAAADMEQAGWRRENPAPPPNHLQEEGEESLSEEPLSLMDSDLTSGLLEVMAVLWEVAKDKLDKPAHHKLKKKLMTRMTQHLPLLFDNFTDGSSRSALYFLSAHLPRTSVEAIARGTFQTLASIQQLSSKTHDHTSLLLALVSWEQTEQVVELTRQWLSPSLNGVGHVNGVGVEEEEGPPKPAGHGRKTKRGNRKQKVPVMNGHSETPPPDSSPNPMLALDMLSWMMCHPVCMQALKKNAKFWDLLGLLKRSMVLLEEHHFSSTQPERSLLPFALLRKALSLYTRMCIHRRVGFSEKEAWFIEEIKDMLKWCTKVLLPQLNGSSNLPDTNRHSNRKRKVDQAHSLAPPSLLLTTANARELAKDVLLVLSEVLLVVGASADGLLEREMAEVAGTFTTTTSGLPLLPATCKLLYQLCEVSCHQELEGIVAGTGSLSPTSHLLSALLSLLHSVSLENQPAFAKAWVTVRQCVGEIIVTSLRISALSITSPPLLDTYSALARSLLQAQLQHIVTNPSTTAPSSIDDLPTFVGCVLKQTCKEPHSTSLFGSHLYECLSELDSSDVPQLFLLHQSALHLIHTLAGGKNGGEEFVSCIRRSMKMLGELSEEDNKRWNGPISEVQALIDAVQDRLYAR